MLRKCIEEKIRELKSTNQYKAKPATLQINAALALIQLDLGSQVKALQWVLDRMDEEDSEDTSILKGLQGVLASVRDRKAIHPGVADAYIRHLRKLCRTKGRMKGRKSTTPD